MSRIAFVRILLIGVMLHAYIGMRLIPEMGLASLAGVVALLWLVCSCGLIPLGLMSRRFTRQPQGDRLAWVALLVMGFFSSLLVLTFLRDLLLVGVMIIEALTPGHVDVPQVRHLSAYAVPLLALLFSVAGFYNARRTARVVEVDIPIVGLAAGLHGFTIAQISDIHVGPTIKRGYVAAIVARVNSLNADLVAVTGDIVDGPVTRLAAHAAPLAGLRGRHGTFLVTGNHEYYSGADAWVAEFRRLGLSVLMNQHVVLTHNGVPLILAGVTDFSAGHYDPAHASDPQAALRGAPAEIALRLLLAHQPRSAAAAAQAGFTLQLSGHTHGGQFFPWNFFVRIQQPFVAGLARLDALQVYTSRGTGYWGPPKRLGAPSEITRLRLVPA